MSDDARDAEVAALTEALADIRRERWEMWGGVAHLLPGLRADIDRTLAACRDAGYSPAEAHLLTLASCYRAWARMHYADAVLDIEQHVDLFIRFTLLMTEVMKEGRGRGDDGATPGG